MKQNNNRNGNTKYNLKKMYINTIYFTVECGIILFRCKKDLIEWNTILCCDYLFMYELYKMYRKKITKIDKTQPENSTYI